MDMNLASQSTEGDKNDQKEAFKNQQYFVSTDKQIENTFGNYEESRISWLVLNCPVQSGFFAPTTDNTQ